MYAVSIPYKKNRIPLFHTYPLLGQRWERFLQTYAIGYPHNWGRSFDTLDDIIRCLEECREDAKPLQRIEGIGCFKFMYFEANQILNEIMLALYLFSKPATPSFLKDTDSCTEHFIPVRTEESGNFN